MAPRGRLQAGRGRQWTRYRRSIGRRKRPRRAREGRPMGDPFKPVRALLVGARSALRASTPATDAQGNSIRAICFQLDPDRMVDWLGDPHIARDRLEAIITELGTFTRQQPATAVEHQPLKQSPTLMLIPGVDTAISQLAKAVDILKTLERDGV